MYVQIHTYTYIYTKWKQGGRLGIYVLDCGSQSATLFPLCIWICVYVYINIYMCTYIYIYALLWAEEKVCVCVCVCVCVGVRWVLCLAEWRWLVGSPKLQIIFHKRATKYRSLLRKMTYKDKGKWLIKIRDPMSLRHPEPIYPGYRGRKSASQKLLGCKGTHMNECCAKTRDMAHVCIFFSVD